MSMFDKAKDLISDNADKVEEVSDQGIQAAGDFAESKGVDADKVTQGEEFLDSKIGNDDANPAV